MFTIAFLGAIYCPDLRSCEFSTRNALYFKAAQKRQTGGKEYAISKFVPFLHILPSQEIQSYLEFKIGTILDVNNIYIHSLNL